jgi:FkbM family methyltransferase
MIVERFTHAYLRSGLRGGWRFAKEAAEHLQALRQVPIEVHGFPPVIVDLRLPGMIDFFANSPYVDPPWEWEHQALMRRLVMPGDVVYDVGANIGLHTAFLSVLVGPTGHVHAFEANSELYDVLRKTVAGVRNATLHEFGLSEFDEQRMLMVPENREMASFAAWTGETTASRPCDVRSLASLVTSGEVARPDFIKCDIEGAELMMLRGAVPLLARPDAPIILSEANRKAARALGYVSSEIPHFLSELSPARYSIFIEETPSRWVRATQIPELNQYVLAVPERRLGRWPGLAESNVISVARGATSLS